MVWLAPGDPPSVRSAGRVATDVLPETPMVPVTMVVPLTKDQLLLLTVRFDASCGQTVERLEAAET